MDSEIIIHILHKSVTKYYQESTDTYEHLEEEEQGVHEFLRDLEMLMSWGYIRTIV